MSVEQVMKGYFKNDVATAETISTDGWLHTGDIARVDSRGNFYIVDRLKELIKVKGFQVRELSFIVGQLLQIKTQLRKNPFFYFISTKLVIFDLIHY